MNEILSRDDILEEYYKFDNIEELFDSDILILPKYKHGEGTFYNQPSVHALKNEFPNIIAKYYTRSKDSVPWFHTFTVPTTFELGCMVIQTVAGMIAIHGFIKKHYENRIINIYLYIKTDEDKFLNLSYEGKASDLDKNINEILIENNIYSYQSAFKNSGLDDSDMLRKYKQLLDDGIITQEEFQAKKKQILGI